MRRRRDWLDSYIEESEDRRREAPPDHVVAEAADRLFNHPPPEAGVSDEDVAEAADRLFGGGRSR